MNKEHKQLISFISDSLVEVYKQSLKEANIKTTTPITYTTKNNEIDIIIPDSVNFQESGRKRNAKRVPIKALIAWGLKYKIQGINRLVYAIQTSIYKKGIRPKKVKFDLDKTLLTLDITPYITDLAKILNTN